ncbi:MAG: cytochrome c5 family protein, partial [Betaproteobacteria bacterium]|nr:cytochrome c5 family protein [Betaproteobacteria bacterium]
AVPVAATKVDGKGLYESTCIACHGAGVAGAPKVGDKAAWAPIIAQGDAVLYDRAIHGYTGKLGVMPPKGGSSASDDDVKAAVDYMVAQSK